MEAFVQKYTTKLDSRCEVDANTGCFLWKGGSTGRGPKRYGVMRVRFPGSLVSRPVYVHRLRYILSTRTLRLRQSWDVSHLCHTSLCTDIGHLHLEPHHVNNARQSCRRFNRCDGHIPHPKCVL
ncbi:hypothetical protein KP79_PYT16359 [Mizuhopecten yessoensis]|uniref:Zinc-binding loop region of homing endonuclease domain-containing protein n=1 Tax=Mizuhopecten yessoensis TaxID=6573 RepID=A0A210QWD3_MIZYE|nr:hypothetical protein KP79_PYT16359 [Mizuhopecten yessoensis]